MVLAILDHTQLVTRLRDARSGQRLTICGNRLDLVGSQSRLIAQRISPPRALLPAAMKLHVVSHPLVDDVLALLRDSRTPSTTGAWPMA